MKLALRYVPTEVWVDVIYYPWISRKKLGKIVHKFRNRYFAEILQYCLHDRGKRTLSGLHLGESLSGIPRTPMPENIKFFEKIVIWHFDSRTLDFLCRISALFLNDVNLNLEFLLSEQDLANLRIVLDHLAPILHGIHSLAFHQSAIPLLEQYFGPKLASIKQLTIDLDFDTDEPFDPAAIPTSISFCLNWLTLAEERDLTEPRFLEVKYCFDVEQFSMAIKQQFQSAKRPSTFVIKFRYHGEFDIHLPHFKNTMGEQMHGQFDEHGDFWIFRHPANSNRTQLEEWVEETVERSNNSSVIKFFPDMTIGPIDANACTNKVNEHVEEEDDDHDKPSTSKKPKLE